MIAGAMLPRQRHRRPYAAILTHTDTLMSVCVEIETSATRGAAHYSFRLALFLLYDIAQLYCCAKRRNAKSYAIEEECVVFFNN